MKLHTLIPKNSPVPLIRVGGNCDGAYLLPNDLDDIEACFSPGVSNRKDFEDELYDRFGIISHMCDFSSDVDRFKTPLKPGQTFKKKWLDIYENVHNISLQHWVEELSPNPENDLILQIDIEGAEYRNLLNTPESIILRFRIIVIELHGLIGVNDPLKFQQEIAPLLSMLDKFFICVHAHPNNCSDVFLVSNTDLNISNVLEVTFLRRDRFIQVTQEYSFPPMLPHPLDISFNVPNKPPQFLNEFWLSTGQIAPESKIKQLSDTVDYLERTLNQSQSLVDDLYSLIQHTSLHLKQVAVNRFTNKLVDLAAGKKFKLSSQHSASPKEFRVVDDPFFFFHTNEGINQFITIDLECESQLFELHIANRTDTCLSRARCLFYCLHNDEQPNLRSGYAVTINIDFLTIKNSVSVTNLRGATSRYITIYSPLNTMLHFSSLKVLGLPLG